MSSAPPNDGDLKALLDAHLWDLLDIARRAHLTRAFTRELHEVTRGKPFEAFQDVIWRMLFDVHAMFVIEFAAWCKAVYGKGGLIGSLQARHGRSFPRRRPASENENENQRAHYDKHHAESFARLFPSATKPPAAADFIALKERFAQQVQPLVDARDSVTAHRYQVPGVDHQLHITDHGPLVEEVQRFLNDIQQVGGLPITMFRDMNHADVDATARHLVDLVLFGSEEFAAYLRDGRLDRAQLYASMHEQHERLGTKFFNGYEVRVALSEEVQARSKQGDR